MAAEDGALSRRDLLRGRFLGSLVGLAERQVAKRLDSVRGAAVPPRGSGPLPPVHRPPGALPESQFLQQCTRCGDCIDACPHSAVILAPARFGPAAGSPMIDASGSPCWMCDGTPCITACEPGALTHDAEPLALREGVRDLQSGKIRGLQICYRYQGDEWWDTLIATGEGVRLVRVWRRAAG